MPNKSQNKKKKKMFIGNLRTKELHLNKCSWVKLIHKKNREYFDNGRVAMELYGYDTCGHCMDHFIKEPEKKSYQESNEEDVERYIPTNKEAAEFNNTLKGKGYFKSWIHNNKGKWGKNKFKNNPTFSVLSYIKYFGYDLFGWPLPTTTPPTPGPCDESEVIRHINDNEIQYVFLIFSGQQRGDWRTKEEIDYFFCRRLTGGNRLPSSSINRSFKSKFSIHDGTTHNSVASYVFDRYNNKSDENKNKALIIDFPNIKYDAMKTDKEKEKVFKNLIDTIMENIYNKVIHKQHLKFIICGFSRGGVLALKLSYRLKNKIGAEKILSVITIDPMIKPISGRGDNKQEKRLGDKYTTDYWYFFEKNKGWQKTSESDKIKYEKGCQKRMPLGRRDRRFPILKGNLEFLHFNVFQRHRRLKKKDGMERLKLSSPEGSAVIPAFSPLDTNWPDKNKYNFHDKDKVPFTQLYDTAAGHAPKMLNIFCPWMEYIIKKLVPISNKINGKERKQGWYLGYHKKEGTPKSWKRINKNSYNAMWVSATIDINKISKIQRITKTDLKKGWYFGEFSEKKAFTPYHWIHTTNPSGTLIWRDPFGRPSQKGEISDIPPLCDRDKYITCPRCKGARKINEPKICPKCLGKKKTSCLRCGGDGTIREPQTCPKCKGKKGVYKINKCARCGGDGKIRKFRKIVKCPKCNGSGRIKKWKPCWRCGGDGVIKDLLKEKTCPRCNGTKTVKCLRCGGDGTIRDNLKPKTCPRCNGKGKIFKLIK